MAVKGESLHRATEDLILPKPRKYYRASVNTVDRDHLSSTTTEHWQLRALISSPEHNIVYYPHGPEIIALNTKTRERERVSQLPFQPLRCLVASKDWLCVGGEDGYFATICLNETSSPSSQDSGPDARLPLDLDPPGRSTPRDPRPSLRDRQRLPRPIPPNVNRVGSQINNCITLWFPDEFTCEGAYKVPIAVAANNDRTVTILELKTSEIVDELVLPDCVNRSVISPDGRILAAVCDDPFLYIHLRKPKARPGLRFRKESIEKNQDVLYEWVLAERIHLENNDKSELKGSFASCFSKSGQYLAVATQYGIISVFDTRYLGDSSCPIAIFTSSRLGERCGAVRAMEFCPGPFDLLAWTEGSSRVIIADVRNSFISRQVITIDSSGGPVERITATERPREATTDSGRRSDGRSSTGTPDYLGLGQLTREMLDRTPTREDLAVLDASAFYRRQRDAAQTPRDVYNASTSSSRGPNGTESLPALTVSSENGDRHFLGNDLPATLRDFINPDRTSTSLRSFINDRTRENERLGQLQREPRRRSSMLLASVENSTERDRYTIGSSRNRNDAPSTLERLTLTPSRLQGSNRLDAYAEIEALYRSRYPRDPPLGNSTRLRVELEGEDGRDFAHRLRQPWRPLDDIDQIELSRAGGDSKQTMGCSWSVDGRILYVGCYDGVYEYHVNIPNRKLFPSLVLR